MATKKESKESKESEVSIVIPPIQVGVFSLKVKGTSSLMTERFSEESIKGIEDKQQKKPKQAQVARDPKKEAMRKLYPVDGGYGIKAAAFKKAAVEACRFIEGMPMTVARGSFYVMGDIIKIKGPKPVFRTDMGKLKGTTAIPIYRMEFKEWSVELQIRFNLNKISAEQIANLLNTAGFHVGVGAWRPACSGTFGMFEVGMRK